MKNIKFIIVSCTLIVATSSCKKFIEIDPPRTELVKSTVFANDATANAAMTAIYYEMRSGGFASGQVSSITSVASHSADEPIAYSTSLQQFNENGLDSKNLDILELWSSMYKTIYNSNAVIEGVTNSTGISASLKSQLEGEAKFIRAFCHFYLVNLFGDIPMALSTNSKENAEQLKAPKSEVYAQIISDLKNAQNLLSDGYTFSSNLRVRVNKGAATALLARVFLYNEEWANAEAEATRLIENTGVYSLESDLELVFRASSKEAILQLWSSAYPYDRSNFFVSSAGPYYASIRPEFRASFDINDQRWPAWGQSRVVEGVQYYGILKYFDFSAPPLDYSTIMRLAEQYLIRAEARAKLGKLKGANSAESDINIIRNRAGLGNTTANTQSDFLIAIENERKWELFGEWGHRWLDLKRTNRATAVLAPIKGSNWNQTDMLYPIPESQIINSKITQNPGY
jgi:starch-binding outer membrane protein, SusD/RagB family